MSGRVAGWRRSAHRTRLHRYSLLTGNFTGNFAILGPCEPSSMQDTAVLQRFLAQFPKQIIREKISKNKEFLGAIREFDLQNFKFRRGHAECVSASQNWRRTGKRPFLKRLFLRGSNDSHQQTPGGRRDVVSLRAVGDVFWQALREAWL